MDKMTNEEAIAIIRKEYLCVDRDCDIERSCGKCDLAMPSKEPILQAYKLAIKALMERSSAYYNNGWIPVSERLPSDCGYDWVLAQIQESDTGYLWLPCVAEYRKGIDDWFSDANDIRWLRKHEGAFKVIAWMPLPEPYKASPTGAEEENE